jgi:Tol biopolymer transport system component
MAGFLGGAMLAMRKAVIFMSTWPFCSRRWLRIYAWLIAAVGLLALISALLVGDARSASQGSELITFAREKALYVMGTDGTGVRLLWRGKRRVLDVAWSPDGHMLAVGTSALSGHPQSGGIWVMKADGSNPLRVASVPATSLTWSPDGRRIAFTSTGFEVYPDIWVMKADGSSIRLLRRTPRLFGEGNVDWSPDGRRLLFDSEGGWGFSGIYAMNANGSNIRRLTTKWGRQPEWSPDGRRIAFASFDPRETISHPEVAVMTADGRNVRTLTEGSNPVWSPDGRKIAFLRGDPTKPNSWECYVINADGTALTRLTYNGVGEASPAWQPVVVP